MHSATALMAAVEVGGYVSILKLIPVIIILLAFARLMTWIDKDATAAHLPRQALNSGIFIAGLVGVAAFFLLPNFWLSLLALVLVPALGIGVYLSMRQKEVGLKDLKKEFNTFATGVVKRDKKAVVKAGQVQVIAKGGAMLTAPKDTEDPDYRGYQVSQDLLTDPLRKNAERIEVKPSEGSSMVQFIVDGVAYSAPTLDQAGAVAGISYMKKAAGLDVENRRKPQTGTVKAVVDNKKYEIEVQTAGTTAGESMRLTVNPKKKHDIKIDSLGLLPDQAAVIGEVMAEMKGIVLVTAPRGQGLTTMLYGIIRAHDAFTYHIQTVEHAPKEDLEGITQNRIALNATPAEEAKQVEWVCSQQPDIVMVDEIASPQSARELVRFASEGKRVYLGMRANNTFDALSMWRRLAGDDEAAVKHLRLIMAGRVLRRLCMACKVAYEPDPETLRKLNMDPSRVSKLFQARTQPLRDQKGNPIPCEFCQELRFKGRFGVFEFFQIDDEVKQAVAAGGSVNQLKTVFRKQRSRYLQEAALFQVEQGETSVQEVLRVLRSSDGGTTQAAGAPPRGAPPPAAKAAVAQAPAAAPPVRTPGRPN
jgi:type II secretory ATPase GspE/PulE/Tfp pilus assembly ATPase PilB-like protein